MEHFLFITQGNDNTSLEYSYKRAFESLNYKVHTYNFYDSLVRNNSFKGLLKTFNVVFNHIEHKTSIQKANIELTKFVIIDKPTLIVVFTNTSLNPSTIAYIRSIGIKVILIYPDAIVNMQLRNSINLSLYTKIFTYSNTSIKAMEYLGANNIEWCPLAADNDIHYIPTNERSIYKYDISFIGNYRPEREEVLHYVIKNFPNLKIKIIGDWKSAKSNLVKEKAENRHIFGQEYSQFIHDSFISLNIIDHTNFPAANMRFFEILISGGFQLSSSCPEMEIIFNENQHLLYYQSNDDLIDKINYCLDNKESVLKMKNSAQELVLNEHLYKHRATQILQSLANDI